MRGSICWSWSLGAKTWYDAVETAAWKVLEAKLRRILPVKQTSNVDVDFQAHLASLLGEKTPASSLFPLSILEGVPQFKALSWSFFQWFSSWTYLVALTCFLRRCWGCYWWNKGSESFSTTLSFNLAPHHWGSICWLSEASMDPGYDPSNKSKDFGGRYALVKKDHLIAKQLMLWMINFHFLYELFSTSYIALLCIPSIQNTADYCTALQCMTLSPEHSCFLSLAIWTALHSIALQHRITQPYIA